MVAGKSVPLIIARDQPGRGVAAQEDRVSLLGDLVSFLSPSGETCLSSLSPSGRRLVSLWSPSGLAPVSLLSPFLSPFLSPSGLRFLSPLWSPSGLAPFSLLCPFLSPFLCPLSLFLSPSGLWCLSHSGLRFLSPSGRRRPCRGLWMEWGGEGEGEG